MNLINAYITIFKINEIDFLNLLNIHLKKSLGELKIILLQKIGIK
jgi:hypothetical protein